VRIEPLELGRIDPRAVIDDVRDPEAEQGSIEAQRRWHVGEVQPDVAKPPHFERPFEQHSTDTVELIRGRGHVSSTRRPELTAAACLAPLSFTC